MGIMKNLISDADKFLLSGLLLLFIAGCAKPSYQSDEFYEYKLKKRQVFYPDYHPGDIFAHSVKWIYRGKVFIFEIWNECDKVCKKKFNCIPMTKDYIECYSEFNKCGDDCIEEKYLEKPITKHIEGGYYSDGSYYASYPIGDYPIGENESSITNIYYFRNIHPTRLKYDKTKWQKDRDECMELTDENATGSIFEYRAINNSVEYYRNCLKERGYQF